MSNDRFVKWSPTYAKNLRFLPNWLNFRVWKFLKNFLNFEKKISLGSLWGVPIISARFLNISVTTKKKKCLLLFTFISLFITGGIFFILDRCEFYICRFISYSMCIESKTIFCWFYEHYKEFTLNCFTFISYTFLKCTEYIYYFIINIIST